MDTEQFLAHRPHKSEVSRPILFDLAQNDSRLALEKLIEQNEIRHVRDDYREQLRELFQVENPPLVYTPEFDSRFETYLREKEGERPLWQQGRWAYFPWNSTLVHILGEEAFFKVRTARNKYLITADEQNAMYHAVIGVAGLSAGHGIVLALVLQGGARHLRIADLDRLALSNTNRILTGVENLGERKVDLTARMVYAMNPYAVVEVFADGLTEKNIDAFFEGPPKLDIVIDEIDNLAVKYRIRERARRHRLAIVMAADDGDGGVVDIERYDENPDTEFFHGRMGRVTHDDLAQLDKFGIGKMITKHVGPENVPERMQQSLLEIGKTIVSWPQLGGAALLNGAAVAYCVRKILNKQPLESNRAIITLDEKLLPDYAHPKEILRRQKIAGEFRKKYSI
ncbi:MAG: ThiF family adenylyltransferase [Parcubacteria group bacterium]|nr:ThiF family adenylyltransferase [Parcubacteria group bacterium]